MMRHFCLSSQRNLVYNHLNRIYQGTRRTKVLMDFAHEEFGVFKSLRLRLCEAQNHRCAVCAAKIEYASYSNSIERASVCKLDRSLPKSYDNCVVTCHYCSGGASTFTTLTEYNERRSEQKAYKEKTEYPETILIINEALSKYCVEENLPFKPLTESSKFRYAPPTALDEIINTQIAKIKYGQSSRIVKPKKTKTTFKWCSTGRTQKEAFSEMQNHRCCYCGEYMNDENRHPRQATWEHVICKRDRGENSFDNLVIACSVCNSLRDMLKLEAEEFYEWVQTHRKEIEQRSNLIIRKRAMRRVYCDY